MSDRAEIEAGDKLERMLPRPPLKAEPNVVVFDCGRDGPRINPEDAAYLVPNERGRTP